MKTHSSVLVLILDIIIIFSSFVLSLFIINDFTFYTQHFYNFLKEFSFIIATYLLVFLFLGMYKSVWKYVSFEEVMRGVFANFLAINISFGILIIFNLNFFNYSFYTVAFFVVSSGTIGMRLSYRTYKFYLSHLKSSTTLDRTIIIGAGNAGILLVEEVNKNPKFKMKVIGFIDDNKKLSGKTIRGIPVLGKIDDLSDVVFKYNAKVIVIAIPSLSIKETTELINLSELTGCKIKLMPPFYEMVGSKESLIKLRDVKIEDLLGRKSVYLDEGGIKEYIDSKTIVVTGGGGSIGSELCRQIIRFNPKRIIIIDIYENGVYDLQMEFDRLFRSESNLYRTEIIVLIASVRDEQRIDEIFEEYKPDVVFHAAAHKHVPLMEASPKEAIKNNVLGTYIVANMSDKHGVKKFVFISTDKAVNPTNVMGATKRFAERIIMALNGESKTDFAAVRFGNVLGSNGSVIPLFKKQIAEGGPVTVTHPDIIRYFMTISEACQLVIQAGAFAKGGELFVLDMGEPVKILDLAEKLIRFSGLEPYRDIEILFTGLRPGEKMFEELLVDFSKASKTENDKIFVEPTSVEKKYNVLEEMANIDSELCKSSNGAAIKLLKQYVTTYKNGN